MAGMGDSVMEISGGREDEGLVGILKHILTDEQQLKLKALRISNESINEFFYSLPREQKRKFQFVNGREMSNFNNFQRLEILKYLERNPRNNGISHEFLRGLGVTGNRSGLNNLDSRLFNDFRLIMECGRSLSELEE